MKDQHTLAVIYSVLVYWVFLRGPLGRWMQRGLLRQGRLARMQCILYIGLQKLRLMPVITLPNIQVTKLIEKPLPRGFAVRLWEPDDLQACLDIYRMNAPGRFPAEVEKDFEALLEKGSHAMLVIENNGCVIACGGASLESAQAFLFYGLIHPEFQKQGLGRLLLLSRLVRFQGPSLVVNICAVAASIGYYERYGFMPYALWRSHDGEAHPVAAVSLHPDNCDKFAGFLIAEGYPVMPALSA